MKGPLQILLEEYNAREKAIEEMTSRLHRDSERYNREIMPIITHAFSEVFGKGQTAQLQAQDLTFPEFTGTTGAVPPDETYSARQPSDASHGLDAGSGTALQPGQAQEPSRYYTNLLLGSEDIDETDGGVSPQRSPTTSPGAQAKDDLSDGDFLPPGSPVESFAYSPAGRFQLSGETYMNRLVRSNSSKSIGQDARDEEATSVPAGHATPVSDRTPDGQVQTNQIASLGKRGMPDTPFDKTGLEPELRSDARDDRYDRLREDSKSPCRGELGR